MIKTRTTLIKLLAEAKIEAEISGAGRSLQVTLKNDKDMKKFCKKVAPWKGFGTGWGGWILRQDYQPRQGSEFDFNSRFSSHHY